MPENMISVGAAGNSGSLNTLEQCGPCRDPGPHMPRPPGALIIAVVGVGVCVRNNPRSDPRRSEVSVPARGAGVDGTFLHSVFDVDVQFLTVSSPWAHLQRRA